MITLVPLGHADRALVEGLRSPLQRVFQTSVTIQEVRFDLSSFYNESRAQFNSTQILQSLQAIYAPPDGKGKLLAVVPHDLFIPILTYVFGEAELGGDVAVVSYYRFQNELYGLPKNKALLTERLRKEAVHELGHAHGLIHCSDQQCVMHTSTYAEDIDLKSTDFCTDCTRSLAAQRPFVH